MWRPRYLALGDDGYLRYHESIPVALKQAGQQPLGSYNNLHNIIHHTHRPKTILAILDGARTIDPYSVVDQHVALPQGVHGFVFRGRPVELNSRDSTTAGEENSVTHRDAIIDPNKNYRHSISKDINHSTKAAVVNLVFPKGSGRRKTAQKIAKAAINPDVLCAFGRNCEGGIGGSRNSSSSSLVGLEEEHSGDEHGDAGQSCEDERRRSDDMDNRNCNQKQKSSSDHPITSNPLKKSTPSRKSKPNSIHVQAPTLQSREYLCAVSTAAEAESWVVALTWAAEWRRRNSHKSSISGGSHKHSVGVGIGTRYSKSEGTGTNIIGGNKGFKEGHGASNEMSSSIEDVSHKSSINATSISSDGTITNSEKSDNGGGDSGSGSKESLNSLVSVEDGWCKADRVKKSKPFPKQTSQSSTPKDAAIPMSTSVSALENVNDNTITPGPKLSLSTKASTTADTFVSTPASKKRNTTPNPATPTAAIHSTYHGGSCREGATIAITKINNFRLSGGSLLREGEWSRGIPSLPFPLPGDALNLDYEIKVLLLKNCVSTVKAHPDHKQLLQSVQTELAEERVVFKTITDVLDLIDGLVSEFSKIHNGTTDEEDGESDKSTPQRRGRSVTSSQSNILCLLQDTKSDILSYFDLSETHGRLKSHVATNKGTYSTKQGRGPFFEINSLMENASSSIGIVDSAMRSLSKERSICASLLFQQFLCLCDSKSASSLHATNNKTTSRCILIKGNVDDFVRKWLSQLHIPSTFDFARLFLAVTFRHRFGGPLLSLLMLWSCIRCISITWFMISGAPLVISIPVDTYAGLIALAFYFGHDTGMVPRSRRFGDGSCTQQTITSPSKRRHLNSKSIFQERVVVVDNSTNEIMSFDDDNSTIAGEDSESECESFQEMETHISDYGLLSSPLPVFPANGGVTCWSRPDHTLFMVRSATYLEDRVKTPSAPAPFPCRGVDVWITNNAERNIARHPSVLGGKLAHETGSGTFIVNFLLPFGNFVAYFTVPSLEEMPPTIARSWSKFVKGDQQYRDGKLKLLPVVVDGPWIVRKAVGPGTSPAMLGRDLPLQYYFTEPTATKKGIYEVDILISASRIARGILNVVKGHTKALTIAFAFIIEADNEAELPETVLCAFQVHSLHLEDCPQLPECYLDD